ncbi:MAG: hypothetical protein LBO65_04060 [Spirochaetaceae bacterium]|jgi:hypothetical protein|nr:hypothetical protein [Spirochaetaceae bacterium]
MIQKNSALFFMLVLCGPVLFADPPDILLPGALDFPLSLTAFSPEPLAEESLAEEPLVNTPITQGKPQWVKDLRRAEIVAFGSFPFTMFFTATFTDLYRCASHGWDRRYAPWPFKSAGAVSMDTGELRMMFTVAISSSLVISLVDYLIVRYKRSRTVIY